MYSITSPRKIHVVSYLDVRQTHTHTHTCARTLTHTHTHTHTHTERRYFSTSSVAAATDEDSFILTTDADVKFTPYSVEALLDLITRDPTVGAVCSRTYPMGSGPLYWYQIFDYAIGHWLQKVLDIGYIITNFSYMQLNVPIIS